MANLRDFFRDLLNWEEQKSDQPIHQLRDASGPIFENTVSQKELQARELIHQWPQELCDMIGHAFEDAVSEASLKNSVCPIKLGSTNQSIGNQVEKYTIQKLDAVISIFSISKCRGGGYPDQILIQESTNLHMPLEVKATADWNEKDSNRRVLTSSSQKLKTQFSEPIYHLLLTILYSSNQDQDSVTIDAIRLDFLEPTTAVNVRLEASVNHKILAEGHHYSRII